MSQLGATSSETIRLLNCLLEEAYNLLNNISTVDCGARTDRVGAKRNASGVHATSTVKS